MRDLDLLIDDLAEDAGPVRPQSTRRGWLALTAIGTATIAAIAAMFGLRDDVVAMAPSPVLAITAGLMLLLAIAAGAGAVRMARPQVGAPPAGANWVLAALLLLPVVAVAGIAARPALATGLDMNSGLRCLAVGLAAAASSLAFLTLWLSRGAPVLPSRAAWLAGLASGAIGALAVTIECPEDALAHLAVWHVAVVLAAGAAARWILPRFLRW